MLSSLQQKRTFYLKAFTFSQNRLFVYALRLLQVFLNAFFFGAHYEMVLLMNPVTGEIFLNLKELSLFLALIVRDMEN